MALTRPVVTDRAAEYRREEPFHPVEVEQLESLPAAFAEGSFGRRDAEWVVRWYYRRFLGTVPHEERARVESRFEGNDFEAVLDAVGTAAGEADLSRKLDALTALDGVDVPVASAFLQFVDPDSYLVVDERTWTALSGAGTDLPSPYPDPPAPGEYGRYLSTARATAADIEVGLVTLYRALWRLWKADHSTDGA